MENKQISLSQPHLSQNPSLKEQAVIIEIENQYFGIPIKFVHEVLGEQMITPIPLAPPTISGSLNLRGRIVTAIDMGFKLGLSSYQGKPYMCVVVEYKGDFYSLLVDQVREVIELCPLQLDSNPPTLDSRWKNHSIGIYSLQDHLVVILDIYRFLATNP